MDENRTWNMDKFKRRDAEAQRKNSVQRCVKKSLHRVTQRKHRVTQRKKTLRLCV
jgi:hypothetical protein